MAPEVPWRKIAGFRNVLTHDYLGVKLERIWQTIQADLPPFANQIGTMLEELQTKQAEGTVT